MWDNRFKADFEKIPKYTRNHSAVELLKKLILEMHKAGYAYASIGRFLEKDHTTILHHIKELGVWKPSKVFLTPKQIKEREAYKLRSKIESEKVKEARRVARAEAGRKLIEQAEKKTGIISKLREEVFQMYKLGKSYRHIGLVTGLSGVRIQNLLIYHPEYKKIKRPIGNHLGRSVWQLTREGKKVKKFENMSIASKEIGVHRNHISMVCRERIPTAGGFKWQYAD